MKYLMKRVQFQSLSLRLCISSVLFGLAISGLVIPAKATAQVDYSVKWLPSTHTTNYFCVGNDSSGNPRAFVVGSQAEIYGSPSRQAFIYDHFGAIDSNNPAYLYRLFRGY